MRSLARPRLILLTAPIGAVLLSLTSAWACPISVESPPPGSVACIVIGNQGVRPCDPTSRDDRDFSELMRRIREEESEAPAALRLLPAYPAGKCLVMDADSGRPSFGECPE
jgi:hypothetical protein